ncbi:MAG: TraB/GumN family protein [Pseudomonadota bacterium]
MALLLGLGSGGERAVAEAPERSPRAASALVAAGAPRPALWRVADADTTIFLFGSIHVLRSQDKWLFPELESALDAADVVYFEAPSDFFAQSNVALTVARLAFNPAGVTLSEQLSSKARAQLASVASRFSLEPDMLETMRPWYAFMALAAAAALSSGAEPTYGVDGVLEFEARRAGKSVRTFETLEQQIRFFSELDQATQIELLETSLQELIDIPDQLEQLIAAWATADQAALEDLAVGGLARAPQPFFDTIYTNRNKAWAETLDDVMREEAGVFLVVVGAAHLVGEDAVQTLLRRRGFAVERR